MTPSKICMPETRKECAKEEKKEWMKKISKKRSPLVNFREMKPKQS